MTVSTGRMQDSPLTPPDGWESVLDAGLNFSSTLGRGAGGDGWMVLAIALALGVAADILFYRQALGLSAPIFAALVLGGLLLAFRRRAGTRPAPTAGGVRAPQHNLWLVAPILFFAAMVFLRDEPFLTLLNMLAALLLLGLLTFTLGAKPIERLTLASYPLAVCAAGLMASFSAAPIVRLVAAFIGERRGRAAGLSRVAVGLLIALPFLGLFTLLFAQADAVFAQAAQSLFSPELLKRLPDWTAQAIWIGFVTWLTAGAMMLALARAASPDGWPDLERPIAPIVQLGFVESATVLASIALLFLAFVVIQFAYLFGGNANITVAGFTYAEYARRGFFELVAVAVVTMGLLLALEWVGQVSQSPQPQKGTREVAVFKTLCLILIALVLVILASAFQRMSLYESAYGFTSLRLYTHGFMIWMGVVFALKAAALWLGRARLFAFGGFLSLIAALGGLNLLNPDAFIVEQNIQRYLATGKLDSDYVLSLSADAMPPLMAHLDQLQTYERIKIGGVLRFQKDALYAELSSAPWPSYHWGRKQAVDALTAQQDTLNQYPAVRPSRRPVN